MSPCDNRQGPEGTQVEKTKQKDPDRGWGGLVLYGLQTEWGAEQETERKQVNIQVMLGWGKV